MQKESVITRLEPLLKECVHEFVTSSIKPRTEESLSTDDKICVYISAILSGLLELEEKWNSEERWLDGFIESNFYLLDGTLYLSGNMVWGLTANPGGSQWKEPILVKMITTSNNLQSYEIIFADSRNISEKEVSFGLYSTNFPILENPTQQKIQELIDQTNWVFRIEINSDLRCPA